MLKSVCIADRNRAYANLLAERLSRHFGGLVRITVAHPDARASVSADLVLEQYYPPDKDSNRSGRAVYIFESAEDQAIFENRAIAPPPLPSISRDTGIDEIAQLVRRQLFPAEYADERARLTLLHGFRAATRRAKRADYFRSHLADGCELFYFPLMSPYEWDLPFVFHEGPDLSTLLLLSERDSRIDLADFSAVFQYQEGYWTPRPGRGEDFYQFRDKDLIEIIKLFRCFLEKQTDRSVGLIECHGVSLKAVEQIALLCDHLIVDLYESNSYGSAEARRVWSRIIGNLPDHIRVSPAVGRIRTEVAR